MDRCQLASSLKMLTSFLSWLWLSMARCLPLLRKYPLGPIPHPNSMNPLVWMLFTLPVSVFITFTHYSLQGQQMASGYSDLNGGYMVWFVVRVRSSRWLRCCIRCRFCRLIPFRCWSALAFRPLLRGRLVRGAVRRRLLSRSWCCSGWCLVGTSFLLVCWCLFGWSRWWVSRPVRRWSVWLRCSWVVPRSLSFCLRVSWRVSSLLCWGCTHWWSYRNCLRLVLFRPAGRRWRSLLLSGTLSSSSCSRWWCPTGLLSCIRGHSLKPGIVCCC